MAKLAAQECDGEGGDTRTYWRDWRHKNTMARVATQEDTGEGGGARRYWRERRHTNSDREGGNTENSDLTRWHHTDILARVVTQDLNDADHVTGRLARGTSREDNGEGYVTRRQ